jgi:ATP synthase F1 gamma subunit
MNTAPESLQSVFDGAFAGLSQARAAFTPQLLPHEVGTITNISTGIARVAGLAGAGFEELLEFPGSVPGVTAALRALIREYLFISLFRACAESLASENASRLSAMERADKNINELLENLRGAFHRLRQSGIDEELFDVISGFEALAGPRRRLEQKV